MNFAGEKRVLDSEIWHVCVGPLINGMYLGLMIFWYVYDNMISYQWCNSSTSFSIGMKRTNCQVIICTWDFLLQELMRLQPIDVSLFYIT